MSQIFISYASRDRETAAALAVRLTSLGWQVWWDRTLVPGDNYREVIAKELADARCVIVLWSKAAGASDWVPDEANEAKRRGVYLPARLDDSEPPLGFRGTQHANLAAWDGSVEHPEFQRLLNGIHRLVPPDPPVPPDKEDFWKRLFIARRALWIRLALFAVSCLPLAALGAWLAVAAKSRVPAEIRFRPTVTYATLTLRDGMDKGFLASHPASRLTIVDFERADLGFVTLVSGGIVLAPGRVRLSAAEAQASVTFDNVQCEGVSLDAGARLAIGWRDGTLHLTSWSPWIAAVAAQSRLTLRCAGCAVTSGDHPPVPLNPSAQYTFEFPGSAVVSIQSDSPGMGLTLDAPADTVLMENNIALDDVRLTDADDIGGQTSSIVSGQLEYLNAGYAIRELKPRELADLGMLDNFHLTRVAVKPDGLDLQMHGKAGRLNVGELGNVRSGLPTRLEEVRFQSPWTLYGVAALSGVTMVGGLIGAFSRRPRW